jgi:hypothetical protein
MGMMFPLGLSIWRRHSELLPFFWSANGITSMFASVLGMALSIEFGIANTYALGVCFYVVCALTIVASRRASRMGAVELSSEAIAAAPSMQPTRAELVVNISTDKPLELTVPTTIPRRADELAG